MKPLKVFVSSTSDDLVLLRKQVCDLVDGYSHCAESMDAFVQLPFPTVAVCLDAVDRCDLYIGIVAGRYGTIPADDNPERHSFTEIEYRRAYQLGKEIYWFVKTMEESDIEPRVKILRRTLEGFHSPARFVSIEDLKSRVDEVLFNWTRRKFLEEELSLRYGRKHCFMIVPSEAANRDAAVVSAGARAFVNFINELVRTNRAHRGHDFIVGVTGGNTQKQIVEFIEKNRSTLVGEGVPLGYGRLRFLALNSASLPDRFTHTANFLVARLSQIFPGSSHFAQLRAMGMQDRTKYMAYCKAIDVVLGGAAETDGFLSEWYKALSPTHEIPSEWLGDFCYIPVDRTGTAVLPLVLQHADWASALDVNSGFTFVHLSDVKVPVILPLSKSPRLDIAGRGRSTKKGRIGDLVLRHVANCVCVLDEYTAGRLLSRRLCGHLITDEDASFDKNGHLCQAIWPSGVGVDEDARNRRDYLKIVHQAATAPEIGSHGEPSVAEILISDPPGPRLGTECDLLVEGMPFRIDIEEGVRRPGMWSTTLVRSGLKILRGRRNSIPRVLDMGCGSGVVGSLIASLWHCDEVVFSDINIAAQNCARKNFDRLFSDPQSTIARDTKVESLCGNLFEQISNRENLI